MDTKQFAGHTPGPWVSDFSFGEYSEGKIRATCINEHCNTIAMIHGQNWGAWRLAEDNGDAEFETNARLIAAAPSLLAEVERLQARVAELEAKLLAPSPAVTGRPFYPKTDGEKK